MLYYKQIVCKQNVMSMVDQRSPITAPNFIRARVHVVQNYIREWWSIFRSRFNKCDRNQFKLRYSLWGWNTGGLHRSSNKSRKKICSITEFDVIKEKYLITNRASKQANKQNGMCVYRDRMSTGHITCSSYPQTIAIVSHSFICTFEHCMGKKVRFYEICLKV